MSEEINNENEFIRVDGRKKNELRPISIEVGVLDSADGSALVKMGKNIILAAVHGPRELHPKHLALPDKANLRCTYRMATFSVPERKSPAPSRREKEISKVLTEALESVVLTHLYPRAAIDVFIQVIQADGGTRCASATAASLALADAGIPMRDLLAGVAAGIVDGQVVLDLCDVEDKEGTGDLPVVYSPMTDEISLLQLDGEFTLEQFEEALEMAIDGARKIYEMEKEALINRYKIDIEEEEEPEEKEIEELSEEEEKEELSSDISEEEFESEETDEIEVEIIGDEELEEIESVSEEPPEESEEIFVYEETVEEPEEEQEEEGTEEEHAESGESEETIIVEEIEEVKEPEEEVSPEEVPSTPEDNEENEIITPPPSPDEESEEDLSAIPLTPGENVEEEESTDEESEETESEGEYKKVDEDTLEIAELEDKEEL